MSDTATQTEAEAGNEGPNFKLLREKAAKADEATAALLAAQRENGMLKSGIDLESPLGEFFTKSYAGDPADVEALKVEAARLGVPFAKPVEPEPEPIVEEIYEPTGTSERTALQDGAPADTGEDKDPRELARNHFDKRIAEGAREEDAATESLNLLAQAALRGDKRVIVKD